MTDEPTPSLDSFKNQVSKRLYQTYLDGLTGHAINSEYAKDTLAAMENAIIKAHEQSILSESNKAVEEFAEGLKAKCYEYGATSDSDAIEFSAYDFDQALALWRNKQ